MGFIKRDIEVNGFIADLVIKKIKILYMAVTIKVGILVMMILEIMLMG